MSQETKEEDSKDKGNGDLSGVSFSLLGGANFYFYENGAFLDEIYNSRLGYRIGARLAYKGLYGIGFDYGRHRSTVKNQSLIGNFEEGRFNVYNWYFFGQLPVLDRLNIEGKIGGGELNIKHEWRDEKYHLTYNNFLLGLGGYYALNETHSLQLFLLYDLNFIKAVSEQGITASERDRFSKSRMSQVSLGIIYFVGR